MHSICKSITLIHLFHIWSACAPGYMCFTKWMPVATVLIIHTVLPLQVSFILYLCHCNKLPNKRTESAMGTVALPLMRTPLPAVCSTCCCVLHYWLTKWLPIVRGSLTIPWPFKGDNLQPFVEVTWSYWLLRYIQPWFPLSWPTAAHELTVRVVVGDSEWTEERWWR